VEVSGAGIMNLPEDRKLRRWSAGALRAVGSMLRHAGPAVREAWRLVRPVLRHALEFLLALIIVFEEWGWRPLADLLGRLARWRPWAAIEALIIRLPPYAALVVFVLPSTLLLPLKFAAIFLVARGQVLLAGLLFLAAKVVATALVARLFMLTQPALMQIGWFKWSYDTVMPWKEALVERVHASWAWRVGRVVKERLRRTTSAQLQRWQPTLRDIRAAIRASAAAARARGRQLVRELKERWAALRWSF
jgi:hypothetical protein